MSRWFRLYDDTLNDPKILKLSDKTYRIWIGILCVASKNDGALPPFEDIALMLRMKPEKLQPELEKLIAAGLIDHDDDGLRPHNWEGRQYKSDVSTERVKRFRNGKRNVSVTPPDTEQNTDTEAEKKKEPELRSDALPVKVSRETKSDDWPSDYRDQFWARYPRKQSRKSAFKALDRIRKSGEATFAKLMAGIEKIPIADPAFIPHAATWLNGARWDDEPVNQGAGSGNGTSNYRTNSAARPAQTHGDAVIAGMGRHAARVAERQIAERRANGTVQTDTDSPDATSADARTAPNDRGQYPLLTVVAGSNPRK